MPNVVCASQLFGCLIPTRGRRTHLEVLEKFNEIACDVLFTRRIWLPDTETRPDWLLYPQHVGEIHPAVRLNCRRILTPRPLD